MMDKINIFHFIIFFAVCSLPSPWFYENDNMKIIRFQHTMWCLSAIGLCLIIIFDLF